MAEAVGVLEVAMAITAVVHNLYKYIAAVKDAKDEIRKLTQELLALKGALEHFDTQSKADLNAALDGEVRGMLKMVRETLGTIDRKLGGPVNGVGSSFARAVQTLKWPFRSGDVEKYLNTIERAKTWFIMVILRDSSDTTAAIYSEVQRLATMVHEDSIARKTDLMAMELQGLVQWLSPVDSAAELARAGQSRLAGTGKWIWDGHLTTWRDVDLIAWPVFWIVGKSGSGKTVLFSTIVEDLKAHCASSNSAMGLGYHCCSLDNAASQPLNAIFGSILAHLVLLRPQLAARVEPLRKTGTYLVPQNNLTRAQIHDVLAAGLAGLDRFYLLVDALNETPAEAAVVNMLLALCAEHENLRVLVTCTRAPPRVDLGSVYVEKMSEGAVDRDVEVYVRERLKMEPGLKSLSEASKAEVQSKIVQGSHGVFRWAKLCMDRLATLRTGRDIKAALRDIPATLNETYAAMLDRIQPTDRDIAREALRWLCFSVRPLQLEELAEAVILREDDTSLDEDARLTHPEVVLEICQGLVYSHRGDVTLAHDSIRSFLLSDWIRSSKAAGFALDPEESHRAIMRKCVAYLSLEGFASGPTTSYRDLCARILDHPLINYAAQFWPIHSEGCTLLPRDEEIILAFFATKTPMGDGAFGSWVQLLLDIVDLESIRRTEPLYYAASYNMAAVLRLLLRPGTGVDVNRRGGRFMSTPLFVAIWRGNLQAAKLLLRAGADPSLKDWGTGIDSLRLAKSRGLEELLVEIARLKAEGQQGTAAAGGEDVNMQFADGRGGEDVAESGGKGVADSGGDNTKVLPLRRKRRYEDEDEDEDGQYERLLAAQCVR